MLTFNQFSNNLPRKADHSQWQKLDTPYSREQILLPRFIEDLKKRVVSARISAARAVNRDLILLYWDIGRGIVEKQQVLGWGESVVEMVAADLKQAFPTTTGFSPRNLRSAKQFYLSYSDPIIWLQVVAKLPRKAKAGNAEIWPQAVVKLTNETVIELLRQLVAEIALPAGRVEARPAGERSGSRQSSEPTNSQFTRWSMKAAR